MTWNRQFLLVALSCVWLPLLGQQALILPDSSMVHPRVFEAEILEDYKANPKFDYGERVRTESAFALWWRNLKRRIHDMLFGDDKAGDEILSILLIIAAFVFLAIFFGRSRLRGWIARRSGSAPEVIQVLDTEVNVTNLRERIAQSVEAGNYREALRWRYIALLIDLDDRGLIQARSHKTNRDYRLEMSAYDDTGIFNRLADSFDYTWYGGNKVESGLYEEFDRLSRALEPNAVLS